MVAGQLVVTGAADTLSVMEYSPQLEAYFEICKRIHERMVAEGTWPWPADSTNPKDMIESDSQDNLV